MLITVLSFFAKAAFIGFSAYALRRSTDEREYYNDTLELVEQGKYHQLLDVNSWVPSVNRGVIELIFLLLVIIPTFFSWNIAFVPVYLAAVFYIYKTRVGRLFNRNEVFKLNLIRIVFILLTFIF